MRGSIKQRSFTRAPGPLATKHDARMTYLNMRIDARAQTPASHTHSIYRRLSMNNQSLGPGSLARCGVAISLASLLAIGSLSAQTADDGFSLGLGGGFAKGFTA